MAEVSYVLVHSETMRALCKLVRLRTTAGAPVLTAAGWWTLTGWTGPGVLWRILLSGMAAFSFIAFAQVYNDLRDASLDAVSKPWRPIPSGTISKRFARNLSAGLVLASVGTALTVSPIELALSAGCVAAGAAYSLWLKNTVLVGNITVAFVSSCTFGMAGAAVDRVKPVLLIGQAEVFFMILGNEIFKTAADGSGDAVGGLRTIATVWGRRRIAVSLGLCWAALWAMFVICAVAGETAFVLVSTVSVLTPAGYAVIVAATAVRGPDAGPEPAGHRWWQVAWMLGLPAIFLLR